MLETGVAKLATYIEEQKHRPVKVVAIR